MTTGFEQAGGFTKRFHPEQVAEGTFHDPSDILLFVHIPKTAGVSVGKALRRSFEQFHPIAWDNTRASFREMTHKALYIRTGGDTRQVLMGHFGANDLQYWRTQELPIKAASILRDPVERFVSNYNYNCSARHPKHDVFKSRFPTLESYARKLKYDVQLSTLIGRFYSFDHALELLSRDFSFLGVTENLNASLRHLQRSHGLPKLKEFHENKAAKPAMSDEISDAARNLVLEKSRNDLRLHALLSGFFS